MPSWGDQQSTYSDPKDHAEETPDTSRHSRLTYHLNEAVGIVAFAVPPLAAGITVNDPLIVSGISLVTTGPGLLHACNSRDAQKHGTSILDMYRISNDNFKTDKKVNLRNSLACSVIMSGMVGLLSYVQEHINQQKSQAAFQKSAPLEYSRQEVKNLLCDQSSSPRSIEFKGQSYILTCE
jgi:hypothetical protein